MRKVTCIEANSRCTLGKEYVVRANNKGNNVITLDDGKTLHAFRDGNKGHAWTVTHYGNGVATHVGLFKDL